MHGQLTFDLAPSSRSVLAIVVAAALGLAACNGFVAGGGPEGSSPGEGEAPEISLKSVPSDSMAGTFRTTYYDLANEAATSGQHTGDTSLDCNQHGLSGCYHREFLCSGWGVAMEGTGVALNGQLITYVSGGGGWTSGYRWLSNCASAKFTVTDAVRGASGRALVAGYSIAVDPAVIPLGWYVWIDKEQQWFRADDTGGAIDGNHVDIYVGNTGRRPAADYSAAYVTKQQRQAHDPSPYGGAEGAPKADGDTCGGLDYRGECVGTTLRWCVEGTLKQADCAAHGLECGWQSDEVGHNCLAAEGEAPPAALWCGDGLCSAPEDCTSCPGDCGTCPPAGPTCGDGTCDSGEGCQTCPADCGTCPVTDPCQGLDYYGECNGDLLRWCDNGELRQIDCAASGNECRWESATVGFNCLPASGGTTGSTCGDGSCDADESCVTCPGDCGTCPPTGSVCGNGACEADEDCGSCAADCGTCDGPTCNATDHLGYGENADPCWDPAETWRCAYSDHWGAWASQVCRGGEWVTYHLSPLDCAACCGSYSNACE